MLIYERDKYKAPKVAGPMQFGPKSADKLSPDQHEKLVNHLIKLLRRDSAHRAERISNMRAIEMDLLGIVAATGSDCDRQQKREEGKDVAVPDSIYPFGWLTLQKFAAELMSIIMPTEAPYAVATKSEKQEMANAMAKAFRHMGVMFDHRNNMQAAVFDALALDCSAVRFEWTNIPGASVTRNPLDESQAQISQYDTPGLELQQLDPYNISWDPAVATAALARKGEFFAEFCAETHFLLERARQEGKNFLSEKLSEELRLQAESLDDGHIVPASEGARYSWYYYEPKIAQSRERAHAEHGTRQREMAQTNFTGIFTGASTDAWSTRDVERIQLVKMFVRIKPSKWGLTSGLTAQQRATERFEIWEIHLAGPGYICYAQPVPCAVDLMPVTVATMNFNRKFGRSFNFGNHAAQLGLLASTILNMHKRSMRKALEGGVTIYNSKVIPLDELDDMHGGRLPANMAHHDDDIRRHVMQLSGVPDNSANMRDALGIGEFLDGLFPTQSQPMMAGLDRATSYQAQAVMATGLRSLIFYATILDGQLMVPARFHLQHQTLLNAEGLEYLDERKQAIVEITAEDMQNAQFHLVQSQPLMGIDRLRATNELRDMINIMFQSGGQLPPIAELFMKHHMQMNGIPIDMDEYMRAAEKQAEYEQQILARKGGQGGPAPQGQPEEPPQF